MTRRQYLAQYAVATVVWTLTLAVIFAVAVHGTDWGWPW